MDRRERVIEALSFRKTDFVPYTIGLTSQAHQKTAEYLKNDNFMADAGNHITTVGFGGMNEIKPEYFQDDFGVVWNRTGADKDIGVIDNLMIPEPEKGIYKFPDIPVDDIRKNCEQVLAEKQDMFTAATIGFSLFERAWTLTGMENLLAYMIIEPDFVHWLMREITEFNIGVLKIYMEYDFDCIHFGDDWGQQKGLIMGPTHWRRFIKPYLAEMYAAAKNCGKFLSQHSCGDILEIFPDLVDIGLNIYQTFQPEIYDIKAVKERYDRKLSFWGGISTQRLLPFETPERVVEVTREIMKIMSRNGGYIASPTHGIPGDVPPENIIALMEFFKNQN